MKTKHLKQILAILSTFLLFSCNEKFESSKWKPVENGLYGKNYRKKMLDDLLTEKLKFPHNSNEKGTKRSEVIKLIGKPSKQDSNGYDIYEIEEKQGMIDPNGFINLKLIYNSDSTLQGYIVEEGNYAE